MDILERMEKYLVNESGSDVYAKITEIGLKETEGSLYRVLSDVKFNKIIDRVVIKVGKALKASGCNSYRECQSKVEAALEKAGFNEKGIKWVGAEISTKGYLV